MSLSDRIQESRKVVVGPTCATGRWVSNLNAADHESYFLAIQEIDAGTLMRSDLYTACVDEGLTTSISSFYRHLKHMCGCPVTESK